MQTLCRRSDSGLEPRSCEASVKEMENWLSSDKRTLDHGATVHFFSFSQKTKKKASDIVTHFLKTSACGDLGLHPLLVKLLQVFVPTFLNIPLKPAVASVAFATIFPCSQFSIKMLLYCVNSQPFQQWHLVAGPPYGGCSWSSSVIKPAIFPVTVVVCIEL